LLSYRHSFHSGNFADVIKHIVLVEVLERLVKKDKPFDYIDTHAGAGLFDLKSGHATRLDEYQNGIARLEQSQWPELAKYLEIINRVNENGALAVYPGSPFIARCFLRPGDKAWLYELHPADFELLKQSMGPSRQVKIQCQDGLSGLLGLLPPTSRRGLVLIDPSYEIKTDYDQVLTTVSKAYKKFSTGIYAIWYPVVERLRIDRLEAGLINSGIRDIQRYELAVAPDSTERGMTAAGMIVINPPWGLHEKMSALLPRLVRVLSDGSGFSKCDVLVAE
jgi:23S rRNA (adenine2030-N6)-methyltransferase